MPPRQVGRDHGAAHTPCLEGPLLLVERADDASLLVIEHWAVDGTGQMVEREFGGRAGVNQCVESVAVLHAHRAAVAHGRTPVEKGGAAAWLAQWSSP